MRTTHRSHVNPAIVTNCPDVNGQPWTTRYETPVIAGFRCGSVDSQRSRQESWVCPGPDSNRHGVSSEGFSYSLQLSLLSLNDSFGVWTFSLPWCGAMWHRTLGRGRQVSTLSP